MFPSDGQREQIFPAKEASCLAVTLEAEEKCCKRFLMAETFSCGTKILHFSKSRSKPNQVRRLVGTQTDLSVFGKKSRS